MWELWREYAIYTGRGKRGCIGAYGGRNCFINDDVAFSADHPGLKCGNEKQKKADGV